MAYRYVKMQGLGNSFVLFDNVTADAADRIELTAELARRCCDGSLGVEADGVLALSAPQSDSADIAWDFYNADGSVAEMCGNAARAVGRYVLEGGLWPEGRDVLRLETLVGVKEIRALRDETGAFVGARVDMGVAELGEALELEGYRWQKVSVGNPHAVTFVDDLPWEFGSVPVTTVGPLIENDAAFPGRTNVEFAEVLGRGRLRMRVWERGVGETLACATGACAVAVAAYAQELVDDALVVEMPGGELKVEVCPDYRVFMTGPAECVFEGTIEW